MGFGWRTMGFGWRKMDLGGEREHAMGRFLAIIPGQREHAGGATLPNFPDRGSMLGALLGRAPRERLMASLLGSNSACGKPKIRAPKLEHQTIFRAPKPKIRAPKPKIRAPNHLIRAPNHLIRAPNHLIGEGLRERKGSKGPDKKGACQGALPCHKSGTEEACWERFLAIIPGQREHARGASLP